jgi:hypothetical protein
MHVSVTDSRSCSAVGSTPNCAKEIHVTRKIGSTSVQTVEPTRRAISNITTCLPSAAFDSSGAYLVSNK